MLLMWLCFILNITNDIQKAYVCSLPTSYSLFLQPFNATRIPASGLENRVRQLEKEKDSANTKSKGGFWDEFEVNLYL